MYVFEQLVLAHYIFCAIILSPWRVQHTTNYVHIHECNFSVMNQLQTGQGNACYFCASVMNIYFYFCDSL